jgi:hypothetical protein
MLEFCKFLHDYEMGKKSIPDAIWQILKTLCKAWNYIRRKYLTTTNECTKGVNLKVNRISAEACRDEDAQAMAYKHKKFTIADFTKIPGISFYIRTSKQ